METLTGFCFLAVLLSVMLSSAQAQNKDTYVAVGGSMTLKPPEEIKDLTSILWKYNGNLVAEWVKDKVPLEIFTNYKGRTTLDTGTGLLTMDKLTAGDTGLYTVETNNRLQIVGFDVKVVKNLTKPEVAIKPLACDSNSQTCSLTCEGETIGTGPITYSWKIGDKAWAEMEKNVDIKNDGETQKIQTFSCRIKNPVSEVESDPIKNPFIQEEKSGNMVVGVVIGLVLAVVIVGGGVGYYKRENIRKIFKKEEVTQGKPGETEELKESQRELKEGKGSAPV